MSINAAAPPLGPSAVSSLTQWRHLPYFTCGLDGYGNFMRSSEVGDVASNKSVQWWTNGYACANRDFRGHHLTARTIVSPKLRSTDPAIARGVSKHVGNHGAHMDGQRQRRDCQGGPRYRSAVDAIDERDSCTDRH